jgi:hypothetical protein
MSSMSEEWANTKYQRYSATRPQVLPEALVEHTLAALGFIKAVRLQLAEQPVQ